MSLIDTVARNLQRQRIRRHITQSRLATKTGLSMSYISMLERAQRSPTLETLETLANVLNVSPADLLQDGAQPRGGGT